MAHAIGSGSSLTSGSGHGIDLNAVMGAGNNLNDANSSAQSKSSTEKK